MRKFISLLITAAVAAATVSAYALPAHALRLLKGDVNGDAYVTLRDATYAQKLNLGLIGTPTEDQRFAADMDSDGSVSVSDAYTVQLLATRDDAVMNGTTGTSMPAFCPYRMDRVDFYTAMNAKRSHDIEPNDGMLAGGQELVMAWVAEQSPDYYSGFRTDPNRSGDSYRSMFADYGLAEGNLPTGVMITTSVTSTKNGGAFFNEIAADVASKGTGSAYYAFYTDVLMNENATVLCVGCYKSGRTVLWLMTGY